MPIKLPSRFDLRKYQMKSIFAIITILFMYSILFQISNADSKVPLKSIDKAEDLHSESKISLLKPAKVSTEQKGVFEGKIVVEWLDEEGADRKMKLLHDFAFIDFDSVKWAVPNGWIVDGASIPKVFLSIIGTPFVGNYRKASIVHDYYCDVKTATWQAVHRMFYDACIAAGVGEIKAKLMYAGLYVGAPRWETAKYRIRSAVGTKKSWVPEYNEQRFKELSQWIEAENPGVSELEERMSGY